MARRLYQRTVGRCRATSGRHYDGSRGRFVWDAFLFSGRQAQKIEAKFAAAGAQPDMTPDAAEQ
jgi:hypothetical protein